MGTRLVAVGVDAERFAVEMNVPVIRALRGVFLENTDKAKLRRNYAPVASKPLSAVGGEPVINTNRARFQQTVDPGGAVFTDTGIVEAVAMTYIAVFKVLPKDGRPSGSLDPAFRAMPVSSHSGNVPAFGSSMYMGNTGTVSVVTGITSADGQSTSNSLSVPFDNAVWNAISCTFSETGLTIKNHLTGEQRSSVLPAGSSRRLSGRSIRIGSAYSTSYGGPVEVAAVQVHDAVLTAQEIEDSAKWLIAYCNRKGIVLGASTP